MENDKKMTPNEIVKSLVNCRISQDDAVKAIEALIEEAKNEEIGNMGATEYKHFIDICKDYYRAYGYPIKGNMNEIKDVVQQAIEMCGFEKFEEIRNTKENRNMIRDTIVDNSHRFFG